MKVGKISIIVILAIVVICCCVAAVVGHKYYIVKAETVELNGTVFIEITPEDNSATIVQKLSAIEGVGSAKGFSLLAEHNNFDKRKRSGRFAIKDGDNMHSIYRRIVSNEQTPVKLVVPSTRTIEQLVGSISRQLMLDSLELSEFLCKPIYYENIGYTKESLPTLFIPNTYEVYWDIKPEMLMTRLMKERRKFWNDSRIAKAKKLNMTPEEVATLASIVDEETNNHEEMPVVAGMYINRLKKGMPLQADPTVKYALQDFELKRVLRKHLKYKSPHNTYINRGLPPAPICIPSISAIDAVLDYERHKYIYFCARPEFDGRHNFARTLSEHNANARAYSAALNKLKIK